MRVFLVQPVLEPLKPEANRARVAALLAEEPIPAGALVAFPELFSVGIVAEGIEAARAAEIADRDRAWLAERARGLRSWVLGSTLAVGSDGKLGNLSLLFDPEGRVAAEYGKIHPFSLGGEDAFFSGGRAVVTAPLDGFTLQPTVCYDLRFPELYRRGSARGADLIAVQANWPESRRAHWEVLLRARAIENQAFVIGVNCVGSQHGTRYAGGSRAVSPKGEVLAELGDAEGVLAVELDPAHVKAWRRVFPALRDRKDDAFWA